MLINTKWKLLVKLSLDLSCGFLTSGSKSKFNSYVVCAIVLAR